MEDPAINRLRHWRTSQGWSLEVVSGLSGYSPAMLSRVERGERQPSPEAKVAIARSLGVPVGELFPPPARDDTDLGEEAAS